MANLYEIREEIESLLANLVDEETGEVDEGVLERLEQLEQDKEEKIKNCGLYMKNRMAFAEALKAEIDNLSKRRQAVLNSIDRMMVYVGNALDGESKEYPEVAFKWRKSYSVDVVNPDIVPEYLINYKTEAKPMKTEIKKMLRNGQNVPGCILVEGNNLQIK